VELRAKAKAVGNSKSCPRVLPVRAAHRPQIHSLAVSAVTFSAACFFLAPANEMNPTIEIKILDNRLREWGPPQYQSALAAAIDLMACISAPITLKPQEPAILVPTGIALHMNLGNLCAVILPRSGLGHKKGLVLGNSAGLIDADYTAQCYISAWNRNPAGSGEDIVVNPGDRIAQMLFLPVVRPEFLIVDVFTAPSERGEGGFGSTGVER
jgi:dUTP pyrophosphatase